MFFDRFDIVEAYYCLAHDYGLYRVSDRIERMGFRAPPNLTYDTLEENGRVLYDMNRERAERTDPYDRKLSD